MKQIILTLLLFSALWVITPAYAGNGMMTNIGPSNSGGYQSPNGCAVNTAVHINSADQPIQISGITLDQAVYYPDRDGDGFGDARDAGTKEKTDGYVVNNYDCDDTDFNTSPVQTEILGDGIDNDCDGYVDESPDTWYKDSDGDQFGNVNATLTSDTQPAGYVGNPYDCDDGDATKHPLRPEKADGIDNNCDGNVDEGLEQYWYKDSDGDGYGNPEAYLYQALQPAGYVSDNTDCDDSDPLINPGATEILDGIDNDCDGSVDEGYENWWYQDADGDGYGTPNVSLYQVLQPAGYVLDNTDCDDSDPLINPGATEILDGIDNDCDGSVDEGYESWWYQDADDDGYGNDTETIYQVSQPVGYVDVGGDCDDTNASINPGATEVDDGIDNDCDGTIDEAGEDWWYNDADGDGYGDPDDAVYQVDQPAGYVDDNTDCDDTNPDINPGATEVADGVDNDCDGFVDEGLEQYWYEDADADGYGNPTVSLYQALQPAGYVDDNTDCDDTNPDINPGATEIVDGVDNDCDGEVDEGSYWYEDADSDGYGNPDVSVFETTAPAGYVSDNTDCDDTDSSINPGATEIADGIDNDCDGLVDEDLEVYWYEDADGDGYGNPTVSLYQALQPAGYVDDNTDCDDTNPDINPGATEVADGVDNDCDGLVDEDLEVYWYEDADGDGYGNPDVSLFQALQPAGYVDDNTDCDDTNAHINPGAEEVADGLDNDCDGVIDEDLGDTWYEDADGDGYGNPDRSIVSTTQPAGYVDNNRDCNDLDSSINPEAEEIPDDGVDNDCDGEVDEEDTGDENPEISLPASATSTFVIMLLSFLAIPLIIKRRHQ